MKVGTRRQYAVMAMVDLSAMQAIQGACVRLSDIAVRQNISLPYLEQLFVHLKKEGLVVSHRGAQGGYRLSRAPQDITVAEVLKAVADDIHTTRCARNGTGCSIPHTRCLTHDFWESLEDHISTYLDGVTLSDICCGNFPKSSPAGKTERCHV